MDGPQESASASKRRGRYLTPASKRTPIPGSSMLKADSLQSGEENLHLSKRDVYNRFVYSRTLNMKSGKVHSCQHLHNLFLKC